ncbi:dodecin domain-containing protein [bacterium CPR1]|nr:dodecin domain-containing protein [bacterium CPR1]
MSVYKMLEIVGTSKEGYEQAIREAIEKAARTVRNMSWFEVIEQRGTVVDGKVGEYQVKLNVGFRIDD